MSRAPRVSCIVCTYNYGRFLGRCLRSLTGQSLARETYEIVVVDDGSTDDTPEVLAPFAEEVAVVRPQNSGLAAASNVGLLRSRGEYVVRVDADDEAEPDAFERLLEGLDEHPDAAAVYADRTEIDADGVERVVRHSGDLNIYGLIAPGIMFRRSALVEVGMYRPLYWEEHDLMIRLLQVYALHYLPRPLYRYHLHGGSMTASSDARLAGWQSLIETWGIAELRRWGSDPELEEAYMEAGRPDSES